jgi:hypothetical protein
MGNLHHRYTQFSGLSEDEHDQSFCVSDSISYSFPYFLFIMWKRNVPFTNTLTCKHYSYPLLKRTYARNINARKHVFFWRPLAQNALKIKYTHLDQPIKTPILCITTHGQSYLTYQDISRDQTVTRNANTLSLTIFYLLSHLNCLVVSY